MKSAFACRAAFALAAATTGSGRGAAVFAVRSSSSLVSLRTPASGGCSNSRAFADAAAGGGGGGMMGQIKELRARTGAGVMDCKEALAASAGDPAKAELWLLDKARSRFAKKAERPTTEGTLALALASSEALLLELNSETDFVGRLEGFQKLALDAAAAALARAGQVAADGQGPHHLDSAWLSALPLGDGTPKTVGDGVVGLFMQVGENMKARRAVLLRTAGSEGALGTFIQGTGLPHTGTLAALVALQAQPSAKEVGKEHVVLEQEVTYGEETGRVRELLEREGAKLGARVSIVHFVRWKVGDGLEKPTTDFAAEVEKELQRSTKH
ncbi:translation elongation factor Ts, putative [Acanthamoeba castellanii str. Neff]|uniref:Elongation factor Ts, mitochondrial n=1 Tax=Acanthamoeba castellanii (strain ATCC 30010 / Neff) TaxID=1257118 RepID=L8HC08_ACACF|nr:translation elongation factor Ts, putative [Acanthamoeba castellanii str. Neff]ELR22777.1 translation elongation factor Ts, putative [Acanthamoeba castellanii str. Neff]